MTDRSMAAWTLGGMAFLAALAVAVPARAQYFSNRDGYTDAGGYRVQVEIDPYLWLPATSGNVDFARSDVSNHISGDFSTEVPTLQKLANVLHFSFMGAGIVRYGPYFGEIDLQYINASQSQTLRTGPLGEHSLRVNLGAEITRVAPGIGYTVYSGNLGSVPTYVDARAGFAYFSSSTTLKGEDRLQGEASVSGDFVQPWLGARIGFVPTPRWRVELGALVQGMGVDGGSWGWGASAVASYAFTSWLSADLGFRALNTDNRDFGGSRTAGDSARTMNITAYGPLAGIGLRF